MRECKADKARRAEIVQHCACGGERRARRDDVVDDDHPGAGNCPGVPAAPGDECGPVEAVRAITTGLVGSVTSSEQSLTADAESAGDSVGEHLALV